MRITPTIRDALRTRYAELAKRERPKTPDLRERLAIRVLSELDPGDVRGVSHPAGADRLRGIVYRIIHPRTPWTD